MTVWKHHKFVDKDQQAMKSTANTTGLCLTAHKGMKAKPTGVHQYSAAQGPARSVASTLFRILPVALVFWGSFGTVAGDEKRLRVGVFPFENASGDTNLTHWRSIFPDLIQDQLMHASPP